MQRRRVVDLAEIGVLADEARQLGIVVTRPGVVEAGLLVELVAGEAEVVVRRRAFGREAVESKRSEPYSYFATLRPASSYSPRSESSS
jgi:hypothetical protein